MRATHGLRERVERMASEELAGVLMVDPGRYQAEFLELARQELQDRGFIFSGNGGRVISTPDGITLKPHLPAPLPAAKPLLSGTGGWLLIFILSNLVCRPLSAAVAGIGQDGSFVAQVAAQYPTTALLLNVDKMLSFGLLVFGVVVAVALLNKGTSLPVKLAKIYLAAGPPVHVFMAALYSFSDFPEEFRDYLVQTAMRQSVTASIWSLLWTLYFNRSRRVKATYFADEYSSKDNSGGESLTRLGLSK